MKLTIAKKIVIIVLMIMTEFGGLEVEVPNMQIIYQLAKRSVVKVEVKDSVGSGLIWKINDENMVICSNRHILMKDVTAAVTFPNNEKVTAEILGYSQQYDLGFLTIKLSDLSANVLRDVFEVVPVYYNLENESEISDFLREYEGKPILQLGAYLGNEGDQHFYAGTVNAVNFEPVFNTRVIVTKCFSKAGMSGGGLFDKGGRLLGIVSGGDVPEDSVKREADYTFCIPAAMIEEEYKLMP